MFTALVRQRALQYILVVLVSDAAVLAVYLRKALHTGQQLSASVAANMLKQHLQCPTWAPPLACQSDWAYPGIQP